MNIKFAFFLMLFVFCTGSAFYADDKKTSEKTEQVEEETGFGLQARIFTQVKKPNTNFAQNFSGMSKYKLTPGDIFLLTIKAGIRSDGRIANSTEYYIQLREDYTLNIPAIGKIHAKNRTIPWLQNYIDRRIRNIYPVQYVNFILKSPAQFNVFVYGGVLLPGNVMGSPILRVTDAISFTGGFRPGATYRQIELHRDGKIIKLDISKYYTKADFESNPELQPGDKIYVPKAEILAKISGKVLYPGMYELVPEETLQTLINLAGGTTPDASISKINIARSDEKGRYKTISIPFEEASSFPMKLGDKVMIGSTLENNAVITVAGAFYGKPFQSDKPIKTPQIPIQITIPFTEGMTLLSIMDALGGPTKYALAEESYIEKKSSDIVKVNALELWETRDSSLDLIIEPGDSIIVPMMKVQVFVGGEVNKPGAFPYNKSLTVSDYIRIAGGLTIDASGRKWYFIDEEGKKERVRAHTPVKPGSVIYIKGNALTESDRKMQKAFLITTWITTIARVTTSVWDLVDRARR